MQSFNGILKVLNYCKLTFGALTGYVVAMVPKADTFIFSEVVKTVRHLLTAGPYEILARVLAVALIVTMCHLVLHLTSIAGLNLKFCGDGLCWTLSMLDIISEAAGQGQTA